MTQRETQMEMQREAESKERQAETKKMIHRLRRTEEPQRFICSFIHQQTVSALLGIRLCSRPWEDRNVSSFPPGAYTLAQGNRQEANK